MRANTMVSKCLHFFVSCVLCAFLAAGNNSVYCNLQNTRVDARLSQDAGAGYLSPAINASQMLESIFSNNGGITAKQGNALLFLSRASAYLFILAIVTNFFLFVFSHVFKFDVNYFVTLLPWLIDFSIKYLVHTSIHIYVLFKIMIGSKYFYPEPLSLNQKTKILFMVRNGLKMLFNIKFFKNSHLLQHVREVSDSWSLPSDYEDMFKARCEYIMASIKSSLERDGDSQMLERLSYIKVYKITDSIPFGVHISPVDLSEEALYVPWYATEYPEFVIYLMLRRSVLFGEMDPRLNPKRINADMRYYTNLRQAKTEFLITRLFHYSRVFFCFDLVLSYMDIARDYILHPKRLFYQITGGEPSIDSSGRVTWERQPSMEKKNRSRHLPPHMLDREKPLPLLSVREIYEALPFMIKSIQRSSPDIGRRELAGQISRAVSLSLPYVEEELLPEFDILQSA